MLTSRLIAVTLFHMLTGSCEITEEWVRLMDPVRQSMIAELDSQQRLGFLSTLFRVAQADEVSITERDHLQPVIQWFGATDEELTNAMRQAYESELSLQDLASRLASTRAGILLFRECCAVAWSDGSKSRAESEFLDQLAHQLALATDVRGVMDTPLACSPEGERRFLLLVTSEA